MNNHAVTFLTLEEEAFVVKENTNVLVFQNKTFESINIKVESGANLTFISYYNKNCPSPKLNITLLKDAHLSMYNLIIAEEAENLTADINLNEEHAGAEVLNVYLGIAKASINSTIHIHHNAPNTVSTLDIYAIARCGATLSLNNCATIKKGMKGSVIKQKARGLNLDNNSQIKALPILYIDESDVLASHAAAIGSINKDDLFYLMSRGLTKTKSAELVVLGFIKPYIDKIAGEDNPVLKNFTIKVLDDFKNKLK